MILYNIVCRKSEKISFYVSFGSIFQRLRNTSCNIPKPYTCLYLVSQTHLNEVKSVVSTADYEFAEYCSLLNNHIEYDKEYQRCYSMFEGKFEIIPIKI